MVIRHNPGGCHNFASYGDRHTILTIAIYFYNWLQNFDRSPEFYIMVEMLVIIGALKF